MEVVLSDGRISESEANGRLMAAAPELAAALTAALEYARHGEACTPERCSCWRRYAEAALQKAGLAPQLEERRDP